MNMNIIDNVLLEHSIRVGMAGVHDSMNVE